MAQTFSLDTGHKHALHGLHWSHPSPKAVLAIVHGHGEHIGRYQGLAGALHPQGIATIGYDLIGHGESPGKRGHFPAIEQVWDSIQALIDQAGQTHPQVPLFLMGHSMGGNLVANFCLRRMPKLAGVVLSSPWFELAFAPSVVDLTLAQVMKRIYPAFTQSSKLDAEAISRDPKEVKAYQSDPKIHDMVSPGLFMPIVEGGEYALSHAGNWTYPLYLHHGTGDRITSVAASERFTQQAAGGDVTFRPWEGGYHELHHDLDQEAVMAALAEWLLAHT